MPKITFIKNIDDEIIYPKTHEDAILTEDGLSISTKIQNMSSLIDQKSDDGHTHAFSSLTGMPSGFLADGGDSDTVGGRAVDDTKLGIPYLWTSAKINSELNKLNTTIGTKTYISVGDTEPMGETMWLDTLNNVLKYKINGNWIILGTELKYV